MSSRSHLALSHANSRARRIAFSNLYHCFAWGIVSGIDRQFAGGTHNERPESELFRSGGCMLIRHERHSSAPSHRPNLARPHIAGTATPVAGRPARESLRARREARRAQRSLLDRLGRESRELALPARSRRRNLRAGRSEAQAEMGVRHSQRAHRALAARGLGRTRLRERQRRLGLLARRRHRLHLLGDLHAEARTLRHARWKIRLGRSGFLRRSGRLRLRARRQHRRFPLAHSAPTPTPPPRSPARPRISMAASTSPYPPAKNNLAAVPATNAARSAAA